MNSKKQEIQTVNLEPLDVIFRYKVDNELDTMIAECGLNYHNVLINHVGLYLGQDKVIEANENGVVITKLVDFCQGDISVKRLPLNYLTNKEQLEIIAKAKSYINYKYNHSYEEDPETIYCSDLIIRSFSAIGNKNPFKEHKITFKNVETQAIDERWLSFYDNNINNIPEGAMGSHPVSIFKNTLLVEIINFHPFKG